MLTTSIRRKVTRNLDAVAEQARRDQAIMQELRSYGMVYPLTAPGMPEPGPDLITYAKNLGDQTETKKVKVKGEDGKIKTVNEFVPGQTLLDIHAKLLRRPGTPIPIEVKPGVRQPVKFLCGHVWGQYMDEYTNNIIRPVDGPHPSSVMVIGSRPGVDEDQDERMFVGQMGRFFLELCWRQHLKNTARWYVTSLLKFLPPNNASSIRSTWIKDCMPLLHQELRLVRPSFILCLGSDASQAVLGKKYKVSYMEGRVEELLIPLDFRAPVPPEQPRYHKALVMAVMSPAAVLREPANQRILERGLGRFKLLTEGKRFDDVEHDIDHRTIRTLEELQALIAEIRCEDRPNWTAMDAEWHGEHPQNKGAYVRTIQFSWRPKTAACLIWHDTEGNPVFVDEYGEDARDRAVKLMNDFLRTERVCGHFFTADLEWLLYIGMDQAFERYQVPLHPVQFDDLSDELQASYATLGYTYGESIPAFMRTHFEGGCDTGFATHAVEETALLGLESLTMRYTDAPRYDIPLQEWKTEWAKKKGKKLKDLEGYGPCPDEIIVPYGNYDADVTYRIKDSVWPRLDSDYEGNCCREPFWETMLTVNAIVEMKQTGIPVSKPRIDELTTIFVAARAKKEQEVRDYANWPDFNIRSTLQVRAFLFGDEYSGKRDKDGNKVRVSPIDSVTLGLEPVLDTSKQPRPWREIKEKGKEDEHSPGTGKTVLGVLAQDYPDMQAQVQMIRDYRFLDQVLKSLLRPPVTDKEGNVRTYEDGDYEDDEGLGAFGQDNLSGLIYDAGLAQVICGDGRVRTTLIPVADSGRWKSARPPLQNISKRRDDDYVRILGKEAYSHKLRSIFMPPPGMALIEADFKSAELMMMAIQSGDPTLMDHCTRNQLSEDDPQYYDIHSNVAVLAFNLACAPTKKGLKSIGKVALRVGAKNVIFGVAYGRGAKAIALQCKEEGNPITVEEAQRIIDLVFNLYPGLVPMFDEARRRSREERWLCSNFGRFRRFPETNDRGTAAEFERVAMNFGIQSPVASAMDRGLAMLADYRDNVLGRPDLFRMCLQIHDAVMLFAPIPYVEYVADQVIPYCLGPLVPIYPSTLDGRPTGRGPYYLGSDVEVFKHWGEKFSYEEALQIGLPLKYASKPKEAA